MRFRQVFERWRRINLPLKAHSRAGAFGTRFLEPLCIFATFNYCKTLVLNSSNDVR